MATGFNTQTGNGEYRLQFETDNKELFLLMQETARRCVDGKPQTNADRIRAMSDEELATCLECFGLCHYCSEHHRLGDLRIYQDEKCDEMCEQHCLEWLKQPAEEVAE